MRIKRWKCVPQRARLYSMRNVMIVLALLAASPATAMETPVSPGEFEAMVTGKTLSYAADGTEYGAEEYFPNRRVMWSYLDGKCQEGEWYVSGEAICFVYEQTPTPQCWQFFKKNDRLVARFQSEISPRELYETRRMDEPLLCLGPEIGA